MNTLKTTALKLPEYLLIAAVIFYWWSAGTVLNPVAIGLMIVLVLQVIFKNQIVGMIIPSLLILVCIFMLFALVSEFNEFPTFNADAKKLLFVGLAYFLSTMLVSSAMIYKYAVAHNRDMLKVAKS